MIIDAVSESGRVYRIDLDDSFWTRSTNGGGWESTGRIWQLKTGTVLAWPHNAPDAWEDAVIPEIGKHLYIAAKDWWYVSRKIVKIVEVEWRDPLTVL